MRLLQFYLEPKQQIADMDGNQNPKSFITVNPGSTITSDLCTAIASAESNVQETCENLGAMASTSVDIPSQSQGNPVKDKASRPISNEIGPQEAEKLAV